MKLPHAIPEITGSERARKAKYTRDLATEVSRLTPQAATQANGEENDHFDSRYPVNFTKGLLHNKYGLIEFRRDYIDFVEALNTHDHNMLEDVPSAKDRGVAFHCHGVKHDKAIETKWRGWESPRAGHVYELQGPDAGAVGMAPAPRAGSSELAAEMAEVYAMALLRDVPFTVICEGGGQKLCASDPNAGSALISANDLVGILGKMPFYTGKDTISSTPMQTGAYGLNRFERNRREARLLNGAALSSLTLFRGSTPGAMVGPYISQFLLIGGNALCSKPSKDGKSNFPGTSSEFDFRDGFVPYGSLVIDQRTMSQKNCLDYMTDWCSWLDVQNGANFTELDIFEKERRFITTPRDLATYVHFDALYEAYLNAALVMLSLGVPTSKGFPEPSPSGKRTPFATFGNPHILSLVTEIATRCLKAVRRQKFNFHRRCRPEAIGGRLTLVADGAGDKLGCAGEAFQQMHDEIPEEIRNAIIQHNHQQNQQAMKDMRPLECEDKCTPDYFKDFDASNLLLPMAFPEGSPMHPAYGAGHATVAGGCVTMLKAFFEMFEDCNGGVERELVYTDKDNQEHPIVYVPNAGNGGKTLIKDPKFKKALTVQGELDKLAANISIGRNMAGVHYYSDYYDSLRMGERIAVGLLLEQAPTYGDTMECTFKSFDGDLICITGNGGSSPTLTVIDKEGNAVLPREWWLRHTIGEELVEDL